MPGATRPLSAVQTRIVHPALGQRHVAVRRRGRRLLRPARRVARHAARDVLVPDLGVGDRRPARAHALLRLGAVADDRVLDIFGDRVERLALVVMRVDVDDQEILVVPLLRLAIGVLEEGAGVELIDGGIAELGVERIHRASFLNPQTAT